MNKNALGEGKIKQEKRNFCKQNSFWYNFLKIHSSPRNSGKNNNFIFTLIHLQITKGEKVNGIAERKKKKLFFLSFVP